MLALKSSVIDLRHSEKKTLVGFFLLYTILCVVILIFISYIYFKIQKDTMLSQERVTLQEYSNDFIIKLKDLHVNIDKKQLYPRDTRFNTAIYDNDLKLIFTTLKSPKVKLEN